MTIPQLINAGFSALHILNTLSDNSPGSKSKIKKALAIGYPASQILKYLTGGKESDESYLTLEEKVNRGLERNNQKGISQAAGALGILGAGAYGLSKLASNSSSQSAPVLGQGVQAIAQGTASQIPNPVTSPQMPNTPIPPPVQTTPNVPQPNPVSPLSVQGIQQQASQLGAQQTSTNSPSAPAVSGPPNPQIDYFQTKFHKQYPQIENFVRRHQEAGISPENAYQQLLNSRAHRPAIQKFEQDSGTSFEDAVKQIYSKPQNELIFPDLNEPPKETDVVMTPTGAGEIHKIHNNDAYVEESGKLRKVPLGEIEHGTPEARKAIADYLKIEEKDRSGPIAMWFYDPEHKNLWVQWHFEGQVSKYRNVDDDIVAKIKAKAAIPVTTGENEFGSWSPADEESLGAAVDQFLKKDMRWKKSGPGQPKNPNYDTYDLGYDFWEKLRKKRIRPKKI